jgi:hypothetical protein
MTLDEQNKAYEIEQKYQGTCTSMSDEDSDFLYVDCPSAGIWFDNFQFLCDNCSWWMETHEYTKNPNIDGEVCCECEPYEEY